MEHLVAQFLAHTLVNNHVAGQFGSFLQVRASTSGNVVVAKNNFFGNASTQHAGQDVFELNNTVVALIFWRNKPSNATRTTARDNRNFVYQVAVWQYMANNCVPGFVEGGNFLLFVAHYLALAFWPNGNLFKGLGNVFVGNFLVAQTGSNNSGFVGNVCQVGAG